MSSSGAYDATMTGPLCHQGIMDPDEIEEFKNKRVVDLVMEVGGPIMALAVGVIINLLNSILELDPSVLGPITGTKKVRQWQPIFIKSQPSSCDFLFFVIAYRPPSSTII